MSDDYVCPECHLDYGTLDPVRISSRIRPVGDDVRSRLAGHDDQTLRTRPEPAVWSAVEYAAHLADAFDAFVEMVQVMPSGADMTDFFWNPDDRAIVQRYNEHALESVLTALDTNAIRLAASFDRLRTEDWTVTAEFPWGERDLLTMARNAVHEGVHHAQDIEHVLQRVSASGPTSS